MTPQFTQVQHDWIMKIIHEDGYENPHAREYIRYLTELFLMKVEPQRLANGCSYQHNLDKNLHCGKCQKEIWDWFRKYFKENGGIENESD